MHKLVAVALAFILTSCLTVPPQNPGYTGRLPKNLEELVDTTVINNGMCNVRLFNNRWTYIYFQYRYGAYVEPKTQKEYVLNQRNVEMGKLDSFTYINIPLQCSDTEFSIDIIDDDSLHFSTVKTKLDPRRVKLIVTKIS